MRSRISRARRTVPAWLLLPNLPADVTEINVEHPQFVLPAVTTPIGDKRRIATIKLTVGTTNQVSVQLEPRDQSPIRHY